MKRSTICYFLLFSSASLASGFELEFKAMYHGRTINASDASASTGKLVTNSSIDPAVSMSYRFAKSWSLLFYYEQQSIEFKNDKNFIAGETSFSASSQSLGVRWIFLNSVAFRLIYTSEDNFGFDVNGSNLAEIFKETLSYPTLYYDQILYTGNGYYLGFNLGLDITTSASIISNRSGSRVGGFFKMGPFGINGMWKTYKSESDLWEYETQDRLVELTYALSF